MQAIFFVKEGEYNYYMIWLIIGSLIFVSIIWGLISDHKDKMKAKAVKDVENEYRLNDRINEAKKILSKKNFFSSFASNTLSHNVYEPDRSIGLCPKCKKGYLSIGKTFTGYDSKYHKYPTYSKYLRCVECGHRESYDTLKSKRNETKQGVSEEFIKDFNEAYSVR